jgi:hypothetical protein
MKHTNIIGFHYEWGKVKRGFMLHEIQGMSETGFEF